MTAAKRSALLGLALLSACSHSPPTRFYTLSDAAPEGTPPFGVGLVRIVSVSIPGELDRPELVRRVGPNQLSIAGLDRWAAPLDQTIQRVLADDVSLRAPSSASGQQYAVSVDIREFYGDANCNVTLRAVWTVRLAHGSSGPTHPDGAPPVNESIQVPSSGACPAALPAAMSVALGQLSDRILAGVASLPVSK
jgi:uncharacterized lipoprotein YmbA